MSNKRIKSFDVYEVPSRGPHCKLEMSFKTGDGWFYTYISFGEEEPFRFDHKRSPDMNISENEVTPRSVDEFIEEHPSFELIDTKTIYYEEYPKRKGPD